MICARYERESVAIKAKHNLIHPLWRNIMTINGSPKFIYKICPATLWQNALRDGVFRGAPVDLADGYIHFSSAEQAAETSAKHFRGQADLLLLHVDTASLGDGLKWEPSRGGALFPHLYGVLDLASVIKVEPLPLGPDGAHVFPPSVR